MKHYGEAWLLVAGVMALVPSCGGSSGSSSSSNGAVGTCNGTYTPCGGDPTGTWNVKNACAQNDVASSMNNYLASQSPKCSDAVKSADATMTGTVQFASGTVTYDTKTVINMNATLSASCLSSQGVPIANAATCNAVASGMASQGVTGTCTPSGSTCVCALTSTQTNTSSDTYTVSGSTFTEGSGNSYPFCVKGNSMTVQESTPETGDGVLTLSKG